MYFVDGKLYLDDQSPHVYTLWHTVYGRKIRLRLVQLNLLSLRTKGNYKVVEEKLLGFVLVYKLACTELHGSDSFVKCVSRFCVNIRL